MNDAWGWATRVHANEALACGTLRLHPGIEVCTDPAAGTVWLRGRDLSDDLDRHLRKLAVDGIFTVSVTGELFRKGCLLSIDRLPTDNWLPIDQWLSKAQPAAALGSVPALLTLKLERCHDERTASVLVTSVEAWAANANSAPAVRLSALTMAASEDGRVVIRGTPLPSIRGTRYAENFGIAVPCGWTIVPRVDSSVLISLLKLGGGDLALFRTDGSYERIGGECFTRCTRAVSRQTLAERTP